MTQISTFGNDKISKEFLDFLIYDKKMKANTLMSYKRDLSAFFEFCIEKKAEIVCDTVNFFGDYMSKLKKSGKSPATVSRNLASLRSFFRFLRDRGYTDFNPTYGIHYEKNAKTTPENEEVLTINEIDTLIGSIKGDSIKALRDIAIIEMLYACGLKVSELINLKTSDLFLKEGYIKIATDDNARYVPIYKGAAKAVNNYLKNARCLITTSTRNTALFLNKNAKPMTRQGLWKLLKVYGEKAGISKEITPHLIRHSMAVHLLANGANPEAVKDILGHKSTVYVQGYMKEIKPTVTSAYEKAHPKA